MTAKIYDFSTVRRRRLAETDAAMLIDLFEDVDSYVLERGDLNFAIGAREFFRRELHIQSEAHMRWLIRIYLGYVADVLMGMGEDEEDEPA